MDVLRIEDQLSIYKQIFDNARDIILLVGENGKILMANSQAARSYGYNYDELLNMHIYDLRNLNMVHKVNEQMKSALQDGITFETWHFRKGGSQFPVEVNSVSIGDNILLSIIRDITYRKNKEKETRELASIVELSQDAIIGRDLNGMITSWNKGAERMFGYTKEEAIGKVIYSVIHPDSKEDVENIIERIKNGETIENYEDVRKNRMGKEFHVSISASPIRDEDGILTGISIITRDITEIKKKEKELVERYEELSAVYEELTASEEELKSNYTELEKLKEEAEKANTAKSQFLANMSHEIRTPMNGIIGIAGLFEFTNLDEEQRNHLNMLKTCSHNLLEIINNILDLSRIESGKIELDISPINLKEIISKAVKHFSVIGQKKDVNITYFIDSFIPKNILGDTIRLNQILFNLLNNAEKFTERGYMTVSVKHVSSECGKVRLLFSVNDTGIGISNQVKTKIFDPFVQGDISYTKKYSGTGLGLAISKELVKMMNGDIWVESEIGKGSTFYFTAEFTLDDEKIDSNHNRRNESEELSAVNSAEEHAVVLYAEDNEINQKIVKKFLERKGYSCLCAVNGEEALLMLEKQNVDLILMDVQMPVLNGFETTKIIRDRETVLGKRIPVLAVTAYAMQGDNEKCLAAGMDDYISKPVNIDELYEKVTKWLRNE